MITPGQPFHFGKHTLILLMFRKTMIPFGLFVISGAVAFVTPSLANIISTLVVAGGGSNNAAIANISSTISYFNMALFLVSIILGMVGVIIALLEYRNHTFKLDELSIYVKSGIINEIETSQPYRHIRDIHLTRTAIHKLFGTSRLTLVTVGDDDMGTKTSSEDIFDPIDADIADEVRLYLEKKIGLQVIQQVSLEKHA